MNWNVIYIYFILIIFIVHLNNGINVDFYIYAIYDNNQFDFDEYLLTSAKMKSPPIT